MEDALVKVAVHFNLPSSSKIESAAVVNALVFDAI